METCQGSLCDLSILVSLVSANPGSCGGSDGDNLHMAFSSDIAYYGINLNQTVILEQIGYASGPTPWMTLRNTAVGNMIVQVAVSSSEFSFNFFPFIPGIRNKINKE